MQKMFFSTIFYQNVWQLQKKDVTLHPHSAKRKVGRVIDRAGLEIRYTLSGYRGFESLTFRQEKPLYTYGDRAFSLTD